MNPPISEHNLWTDLITPMAVIIAAIIQKLDARKVRKKLEHTAKGQQAIHQLVNGNVAEQKRLNMLQARRIADLTRDPKDIALAEESEQTFKEHQERVLRVDLAMSGHEPPKK